MEYAAYGLGQGLAQGQNSNQLINALNTADLIRNRREMRRVQSGYLDLANQKWEMTQQQLQQELDKQKFEFAQLQKQTEGKDFINYLYGALQSGDFSVVNSQMHKLQNVKQLADQAGVVSFDPTSSYSDESLRELGFAEGMNPREYIVANKSDGTKQLINAQGLSAMLGMGNYYTRAQLEQLYGESTLANARIASTAPLTEEGQKLGQAAYGRQQNLDLIANQQAEPISSNKPTQAQLKANQTQDIYKLIDSLGNELPNPETRDQALAGLSDVLNNANVDYTTKRYALDTAIPALSAKYDGESIAAIASDNSNPDRQIAKKFLSVLDSKNTEQDRNFSAAFKTLQTFESAEVESAFEVLTSTDASGVSALEKYGKGQAVAQIDKVINTAVSSVNPKLASQLQDINDVRVKSNFMKLFVAIQKEKAGVAVNAQEFKNLVTVLGNPDNTNVRNMITGLKGMAASRIRQLQNLRDRYPVQFAARIGDGLLNRYQSYYDILQKSEDTFVNKSQAITAAPSTSQVAKKPITNDMLKLAGGQQ